MSYLEVRFVHIACVALSGAGFLLRGVWMLRGSPWLKRSWVRVVPHLVDTALLASAVALAVSSGQYPLAQDWLTAKLVGLLVYILCGAMALKRARTRAARAAFFVAAIVVYACIVAVAMTRNPLGPLMVFARFV